MKQLSQIFLVLLLVFVTNVSFGQYKYWLGLDLGFNSTTIGTADAQTSFQFSPTVGYWFQDNLGVGVRIDFSQPHEDHTIFGATPFLRWGKSVGERAMVLADLGVNFSTDKETLGTSETKITSFGVGISPGIQYMFADRWSFIGHFGFLGFSSSKTEVDGNAIDVADRTNFGLNLGLSSVGLGLQYHF
ncbi:MAG: porin family protein [Bacteroidota bacterium]|nr:porin family protein [Bacteroidota bacterium]